MSPHPNAVFFVSFPKCGRTWVRFMLALYAKRAAQEPRLPCKYSHMGFSYSPERDATFKTTSKFPKILLTRDPADTLVSYYDDATKRAGYQGTIDEFVRETLPTLNEFYRQAEEADFLYRFSYEDLHEDTYAALRPLIRILFKTPIKEGPLKEVIEACRFDKLSVLERMGKVNLRAGGGATGCTVDPTFFKTRRGVVGSAKDELPAETLAFIEENKFA